MPVKAKYTLTLCHYQERICGFLVAGLISHYRHFVDKIDVKPSTARETKIRSRDGLLR